MGSPPREVWQVIQLNRDASSSRQSRRIQRPRRNVNVAEQGRGSPSSRRPPVDRWRRPNPPRLRGRIESSRLEQPTALGAMTPATSLLVPHVTRVAQFPMAVGAAPLAPVQHLGEHGDREHPPTRAASRESGSPKSTPILAPSATGNVKRRRWRRARRQFRSPERRPAEGLSKRPANDRHAAQPPGR